MRIAAAQINTIVGDINGNSQKIVQFMDKAIKMDADLIVFPELTITGYPPEDLLYKKVFIDDNLKALEYLVSKTQSKAIIVGFVDRDKQGNLYNAAAFIKDKKISGIYRKKILPNYSVFDEKRYFFEGNDDGVFELNGTTFGINICEDIWVSSDITKEQVSIGAKVIINISASPYYYGKYNERVTLLTKRAKECNVPLVYVNLVGGQDEIVHDGGSLFICPCSGVIEPAKRFSEDIICLNPQDKGTRSLEEETIADMFNALVLGTKDYINKNNFKKVVIGISGGIDSAVVAAIAVSAIGKENVKGISMPSKYNCTETISDAKKVSENLGIIFKEIAIEDILCAYENTLKKDDEFAKKGNDVTEENIQARIRGNILMAESNKFGYLVLATSNKSESAVGYATLYGDMTGGFAPIQDVYKTKVFKLAKYFNEISQKEIIPESIIQRAPSAELRENQKDSDSLGEYTVLDKILKGYLEKNKGLNELSKEFDKELLIKTLRLVDMSEYKRRQAAPGIKITKRNLGKDWRLPITNGYIQKSIA